MALLATLPIPEQPPVPEALSEDVPHCKLSAPPSQLGGELTDLEELMQRRDDKLFAYMDRWHQRQQELVERALSSCRPPSKSRWWGFKSESRDAESGGEAAGKLRLSAEPTDAEDLHDGKELPIQPIDSEGDPLEVEMPNHGNHQLRWGLTARSFMLARGSTEDSPADRSVFQRFRRCVGSWQFESFFAMVIFSNSIFIGAQVQSAAMHGNESREDAMFAVSTAYTALFTLELGLRLAADGWKVFFTKEWAWRLLDVLVVLLSIMELVFPLVLIADEETSSADSNVVSNLRILRILRVTRTTRVFRIVKIVKFIRALRTLLYSIAHTLKALVWSMILLVLIIYVFSIVFTDVATSELAILRLNGDTNPHLQKRFGSLDRTMNTLFASITGGHTWSETREALTDIHFWWGFVFVAYISFCLFAVLNVMTGVFCQTAIESAERDHELILQNVASEKAKYFRAIRRLFDQLDMDSSGGITMAEFETSFSEANVRAIFDALEINVNDAYALFSQLDTDGNADVDINEFLEGCMQLKGPARSIDVVTMKRDLNRLRQQIEEEVKCFKDLQGMVRHLLAHDPFSRQSSPVNPTQLSAKALWDADAKARSEEEA
eukprot:TRINITY_DN10314_c0_g1_i1.p1 TRINITY_DN10314_c0_g1~~TRINITY_DN10314_c0_g1_i1.p1  ORF type:complete len:616 (+),score=102.39 TRINITY_DN10314_c0_g1_i1:30-1850(+)